MYTDFVLFFSSNECLLYGTSAKFPSGLATPCPGRPSWIRSFGENISGASLKANLGVSLTIPLTGVPIGFCTGTWAAKPKKARGYLMVTLQMFVTVCAGFSEQFILDHTKCTGTWKNEPSIRAQHLHQGLLPQLTSQTEQHLPT